MSGSLIYYYSFHLYHIVVFIFVISLWWAFLLCWAGLPPAVLGSSVLDKGVGINPIATYLGLACAQTTLPLPNFGHMPMTSGTAMGKHVRAAVCATIFLIV